MVAAAEEKENSLAERQYLLVETLEQQKRCEMLTKQESELRGQLSLYSDKFEEFQQTLTRSNQVFSTFKRDTDKVLLIRNGCGIQSFLFKSCRCQRPYQLWRKKWAYGKPGTRRPARCWLIQLKR